MSESESRFDGIIYSPYSTDPATSLQYRDSGKDFDALLAKVYLEDAWSLIVE